MTNQLFLMVMLEHLRSQFLCHLNMISDMLGMRIQLVIKSVGLNYNKDTLTMSLTLVCISNLNMFQTLFLKMTWWIPFIIALLIK